MMTSRRPIALTLLVVSLVALAAQAGAWAVRVHEVRATADAVRVARAVEGAA